MSGISKEETHGLHPSCLHGAKLQVRAAVLVSPVYRQRDEQQRLG